MKTKTLQEQYNLIKEGKGNKEVFLKSAKRQFPDLIRNAATFNETTTVLKQRSIINEGFLGIATNHQKPTDFQKIFEDNMISEEAKAVEEEPTKEVVDLEVKGFDYKDKENIDNVFGTEFLNGFYFEMQQPDNYTKSVDEIKELVRKNLSSNQMYYVETGQFGEKIGYTEEAPGLGKTKEVTGKYAASGMEEVKENISYLDIAKSLLDE